jgi:ABC-type nitrate/sulfonate/bicarbonate transport system permease component
MNMTAPRRRTLTDHTLLCAGPTALLAIWYAARYFSDINPTLLPPPHVVFSRLATLALEPVFWSHWLATMVRVASGFLIAAVGGTAIGIGMGLNKTLYNALLPIVDLFRSIPVTVLYPVFVLTLGIGNEAKIAMIATGCIFIVALNAAYGVHHSSKIRRVSARLYGATSGQLFLHVVLMEALPQVFIGLRISVSLALIVAILVEMFMGAERGLGQRLMETYATYGLVDMYSLIVVAGITGLALNRSIQRVERFAVPWVVSGRP